MLHIEIYSTIALIYTYHGRYVFGPESIVAVDPRHECHGPLRGPRKIVKKLLAYRIYLTQNFNA